jgi:hypothetical protein
MKYVNKRASLYIHTYIGSFVKTGRGVQAIVWFASAEFEAITLVLLTGGTWEVGR